MTDPLDLDAIETKLGLARKKYGETPVTKDMGALCAEIRALRRVAAAAKDASNLRIFVAIYDGRALDQSRGLAILDALNAALKEAGL